MTAKFFIPHSWFFTFHHKFSLSLAIPLLISLGAGCSAPAPAARFVAQAQRLHDTSLASAVTPDSDLREYLQIIGDRLATAARQAVPSRASEQLLSQLRCHLVESPTVNAFYTGGNHIYIYSGLLAICENEDELAAAVAHEYAHAIALDVEKTRLRPDPNRTPAEVAFQFVVNRFTAAQESAADELAIILYTRGGWEPAAFPGLFDRLAGIQTVPSPDRVPLSARARQSRARGPESSRDWRQPPVADPKTFAALRAQSTVARPSAGSSEGELFLSAFPNCLLSGDPPETRAAQDRLRPPPPPAVKLEPS